MGQMFLKMGMNRMDSVNLSQFSSTLVKMATSPIIVTGLFFYAMSAVLWMVVLSQVDLSYAYPFLGLTYVVIPFLTKFLFNEIIPPWRWVGTAVILLGVLISAKQ